MTPYWMLRSISSLVGVAMASSAQPVLAQALKDAAVLSATSATGSAIPESQPGDKNGAVASAAPVQGGDGVESIVVTARHRSEAMQKVPVALSVISGDFLSATNTTGLSQVAQYVPSMQISFSNPRNSNINIRGLGNNVGLANDGLEPGVGFYIDGIYYERPAQATFDLIDIDRIEVLRGPQGTLFGKNTTAGAISISTAKPQFTPEATAEVTGGTYDYAQVKASVSGPLVADKLAGRLSAAYTTRGGLVTNSFNGDKLNDYNNLTLRGQLLFTPSSKLDVRLIADYSKQNTNCCVQILSSIVSPPNGKNFTTYSQAFGYTPTVDPFARRADVNTQPSSRQETGGGSLEANLDLGRVTLTSITAGRFWNFTPTNDLDQSPVSVVTIAGVADRQKQFSQEFRVASSGHNAVDYVAGVYLFHSETHASSALQYGSAATYFLLSPQLPSLVANGFGDNSTSNYNNNSYAGFGQATWRLTPRLSLTGGLRYSYDDKNGRFDLATYGGTPLTGALAALAPYRAALATTGGYSAADKRGAVSGQVDLSYQLTDDVLAYGNYARGTKSGGLNLGTLPAGASPVVRPETVDSFEAGLKTQWLQRRLTVNLDAFWSRDLDYQGSIFDTNLAKQYLANIPEVRSWGFEADLRARPTDRLSLYASAIYDHATYASYANAPCPLERITTASCNLSGQPLSGVPRWAGSVGGEFTQPIDRLHSLEAFAGADYSYRSDIFPEATNSIYSRLPALSLVNARVGVRAKSGAWDLTLWAKNLFDAKYFTTTAPGFGNTGAEFSLLGDPRTVGVTLRIKYR